MLYLLSCNVSEIMVVALASVANAPLPVRPLQILYLNLVTDVFPALALVGLELDLATSVTISFLTLAAGQLWHVFNMRDPDTGVLRNEVTGNRYVCGALLLCVLLLAAAVYLPVLSDVLGTADPGPVGWAMVLGFSLFPLLAGQLLKLLGWGWISGTGSNFAS